jgi:hypothetical protein
MKITSLLINITDIEDALVLERNPIVESIIKSAIDIVKNGGKVVLQREYTNSPPEIIAEYYSEQEIVDWKDKINNTQELLNRAM